MFGVGVLDVKSVVVGVVVEDGSAVVVVILDVEEFEDVVELEDVES